jgi:hypothetical protein
LNKAGERLAGDSQPMSGRKTDFGDFSFSSSSMTQTTSPSYSNLCTFFVPYRHRTGDASGKCKQRQ